MVILLKRIQKNYTNSITIQKSEFITYLFRVNTILDVENYLNQIRKKHPSLPLPESYILTI